MGNDNQIAGQSIERITALATLGPKPGLPY